VTEVDDDGHLQVTSQHPAANRQRARTFARHRAPQVGVEQVSCGERINAATTIVDRGASLDAMLLAAADVPTSGGPVSRALIVVDMQNSFFHPDGAMYQFRGATIHADEVVEANRQAVEAAHAAGHLVVFTRHGYRTGYVDADRLFRENLVPVLERGGLLHDTWDTALLPNLDVHADDVVVDKARFNAFHGTDLQLVLQSNGVTELLVTGVLTNVCVESTVRSARELDYDVVVLEDCVSTRSERLQEASLESMQGGHFARVCPWTAVLGG
jgi:ureidoacrylate peracid hydrolase